MARSVLLQAARDSIEEVLQAQNSINKQALIQEHPLLAQNISVVVNLFIDEELKGTHSTTDSSTSLIHNIIIGAKKAAFEDLTNSAISTSQYLHCEIELILKTPDGEISEKDPSILKNHII